METVYHDYAPKGVKFYYIYKALAHPGVNGYVQPFTLEERLRQVQQARKTLGSKFTWLCDTMDNDLKHALGNAPNSEFVIDPEGKVVRKRFWSNPSDLRKDLAKLVGPVDKPTRVADLDIRTPKVQLTSEKSPVPRVRLPGRLQPVRIEPLPSEQDMPFYAKLRAEAESSLLRNGSGKLYLGFFLDKIYDVHWNNLAGQLQFEIAAPTGVEVSPATAHAPKVDVAEDKGPREFLIDVKANKREAPLEVTVHYVVCDDAGTFCNEVTQKYRVFLQPDRDAGSRMANFRRMRGGVAGDRRGGMMQRALRNDRNGDGKISKDEARGPLRNFFDRADRNQDGFLDRDELEQMFRRFRGRGQGRGPGGGPPRRRRDP